MPEPLTVEDLRWAEAYAEREADSWRSPFSQDFPGSKAKAQAEVSLARAARFRAAAEAMEKPLSKTEEHIAIDDARKAVRRVEVREGEKDG